MATQFKVSGELALTGGPGFVGTAKEAKAALEGVDQAGQKLAQTSTTVSAATSQAAESQRRKTQYDLEGAKAVSAVAAGTTTHVVTLGNVSKASSVAQTSVAGLRAANDDLGKTIDTVGGKLNTFQKTQLGFQLNDVFTQLASGQGIIRTAVQQGPQITQVFGGIGATLEAIPVAATAAAAAVAIVAGAIIGLASHGAELTTQNRTLENSLVSTGRAAQVTASQLQQLVLVEAGRPGAGRDETQKAAQALLGNNQLAGAAIQQTLSLARDLARLTGVDLPTAAQALSAGLDGTADGARKLDATFNVLTPRELEQIRNFQALGDKGAAISVVLAALQRNLGGANERGITPLSKGLNDLTSALGRLEDKLSSGKVAGFLSDVGGTMVSRVGQMVDLVSGAGPGKTPVGGNVPTTEDIAQARQSLELARRTLADLEARLPDVTGTVTVGVLNNKIAAARARVADLTSNLNDLERQAYNSSAKTIGDQVKGSATALSNEIKEADAVTAKYATVVAQRQQLQADRAQLQKLIDSGIADPQSVARATEGIAEIEGKLRALRTPAEEARRALDLEGTLAKLPPHIQAAERAAEETRRKFLEMGQSEAQAEAAADQARANVLQTQATATGQQIQLLSDEAAAALKVADAYGTSRAAALQLQAQLKAQAAEQQGQIAGGTAGTVAQQTLEQTAAASIAAAAEKNEAYGREVAALGRLVDAEAKGSAAAREAERANKVAAYAEDLRAQAAATGSATIVAAAEKRIAAYDALTRKELAANVRRDAQNLNAQYDPAVAYDLETKKLQELQATGLLTARTVEEYTRQSELRRLEASRDATDGMIAGLKRYADEASNAGAAASDGVKRGLQTMEDALVQFVTTGQINFSNLANSIIADLARIAVRQFITGPIASGLGSVFGSVGNIFGGGGSTPPIGPINTGGFTSGHSGGVVGQLPVTHYLPASVFANAARFHAGGVPGLGPNERPIVALADEEVITRDDPRHRWNLAAGGGGSSGGPAFNVSIQNNGPPVRERERTKTPNGSGGFDMNIILDMVDEGMAQRADAGRGKLMGVLKGGYGLSKVPRR